VEAVIPPQPHEGVRIDEPHVRGYGKIEPYTWKAIAALAATALSQIAVELRRIADTTEKQA
jgi:hypothetical protein